MKKTALILLVLFLSATLALGDSQSENEQMETMEDIVYAQENTQINTNLSIERVIPASITAGDKFSVVLKVKSAHNTGLDILITDVQIPATEYSKAPTTERINYQGVEVKLFSWKDTINPGEVKEYSYDIHSTRPGTIKFPIATVVDEFGNSFETTSDYVVVNCNPDGICGEGENYIFCPKDCPTGSADETCDGVEDGRVDPDCVDDPDEVKELPQTIPLEKSDSCIPMLLAPICFLFAIAARQF